MDLFVLQCITGNEELVRKKILAMLPDTRIIIPKRVLQIRKKGKQQTVEYILFPGYIFFEAESISVEIYNVQRSVPEAVRFLPSNADTRPLNPIDREILTKLMKYGESIADSRVVFDKNNRISVIRGPLEGLEGQIIRVDRRKRRARVKLDMYEKTFEIDFGFSDIEKAESADDIN